MLPWQVGEAIDTVRSEVLGLEEGNAATHRASKITLGMHAHNDSETGVANTLEAVRQAYELLRDDLCSTCPRRGEKEKEILYYMI